MLYKIFVYLIITLARYHALSQLGLDTKRDNQGVFYISRESLQTK